MSRDDRISVPPAVVGYRNLEVSAVTVERDLTVAHQHVGVGTARDLVDRRLHGYQIDTDTLGQAPRHLLPPSFEVEIVVEDQLGAGLRRAELSHTQREGRGAGGVIGEKGPVEVEGLGTAEARERLIGRNRRPWVAAGHLKLKPDILVNLRVNPQAKP